MPLAKATGRTCQAWPKPLNLSLLHARTTWICDTHVDASPPQLKQEESGRMFYVCTRFQGERNPCFLNGGPVMDMELAVSAESGLENLG